MRSLVRRPAPSCVGMRLGAVLGLWLFAVPLIAQETALAPESNNGTVGHAALGGVVGGYSGLVVGTIASRLGCPRRTDCSAIPPVLATAVGMTLGSYAGVTDRNRAYGGVIGAGVGVLGGALAYVVWSGVARAEADQFTGFGMAILGGAVGVIVGTLVSGGEQGAGSGDPLARRITVEVPVRVFF